MALPPATRLYAGHEYVRTSNAFKHGEPTPHPTVTCSERANLANTCHHPRKKKQTLANLKFGAAVEPSNEAIVARTAECKALLDTKAPTLPSTLAIEANTNVFLRTMEPAVRAFTHPMLSESQRASLSDAEVLSALREAKNKFS